MKVFKCQNCGQLLYFENTRCESCGHVLGYLPWKLTLSALETDGDRFRPSAERDKPVRLCSNAGENACNWLIPSDSDATLCAACRHNRTIPDLTVPENLPRWQKLEAAKHHMFYRCCGWGCR